MIIEIKIFSSLLHRYVPDSERQLDRDKLDIKEGTTVGQVLDMLNIPEKEAAVLLINGQSVGRDRFLKEGDVFAVFPILAGG